MSELEFDPEKAIGEGLLEMDQQELCRFVSKLCLHLQAELGSHAWRGGIYPENICVSENGSFAVGPAKREKWTGQELEFVAPELYWHGETGPAADVYSLALLVYYGLNGGKLPFETATSSGQLARMSGKVFPVPRGAGKRLAEILEKATAFQPADRFESPEKFGIVLESCLDNKYLDGESGAEAVFRKQEDELTEIERMMVDIIESGGEKTADTVEEESLPEEELSPEEMAGLEKPEPVQTEKEDLSAMVEEFFGAIGALDEAPKNTETAEEPEDVRLYEPGQENKERQPIPILTVEKNPELEPVVLSQRPLFSINRQKPEQKPTEEEEVKKRRRRRPLVVVLILCALLLTGAFLANYFLNSPPRPTQINPTPDPSNYYAQNTEEPAESAQPGEAEQGIEEPEPTPMEPVYVITASDKSWTDARDTCISLGGHLAVISTEEEFETIKALANEKGLTRLWIGCHRVDGQLVWETDEEVSFTKWAPGEPSEWDAYDNVREDYVMLFKQGDEWFYNDSRNDPAYEYPTYYRGVMGYICEYNG